MKYTSEDLMKAMGLVVGDRVNVALTPNHYAIFTLVNDENEGLSLISKEKEFYPVEFLVDLDFEILPTPKRVGDLKCEECICDECPLRYTRCGQYIYDEVILYDILEGVNSDYKDQEIHDLLKDRLDKEVVKE